MVFALIVMAIFIIVSIYFYFRSERLQQDLVNLKRDTSQTRKDNKNLSDTIALVSRKAGRVLSISL